MSYTKVIELVDIWRSVALLHRENGNIEKAEFWENAIEDLEEAIDE